MEGVPRGPALDRFRLDGRATLVTGAGSGIGRAIAGAVAAAGSAVGCCDIDPARASAAAAEIEAAGGHAVPIVADIADEPQVAAAVRAVVDRFGRLDACFANAGIVVPTEAVFPATALSDWQRGISVNLTGAWLTAREAVRELQRAGRGGRIVFTASIYGMVGSFEPSSGAYQAAKGGVANLTRDLAALLGPAGITVNAIAPGYIRTNLGSGRLLRPSDEAARALEAEVIRRTPLGRVGVTEDLEGLAVFLASDVASYITGAVIPVDGGWLAL